MSLDEEPKTEPGFIITVSLTTEQRTAIEDIKDARTAALGKRPTVRDLVTEAIQLFINRELKKK